MSAISRRSFLKGTAGVAGSALAVGLPTKAVAAEIGADARAALGSPIEIPREARTVEAGLAAFAAKWEVAGPAIVLTRFGRFLSNRIFNCRVGTGATAIPDPRSYVLNLGAAGATLTPGIDPYAHADVVLEEADWLGVLFGDYTGLAPVLAGRAHPSRDDANKVILLGIVMYIFAHVPAGADFDPELLVRILQAAINRGGLPGCEGEPDAFENLTAIRTDPAGEASHAVVPHARAVPVTMRLAEWVAALRFADIPAGCLASAKEQLASILGATYAGSAMAPGAKAARAVRGWDESGPSTVFGADRYATTARNAAMVNSFLAQILEWEDWTFITHSGASIVPVALAVGEHAGASGAEVLTAIVAANEILARAGEVLTDMTNTGNAVAVHQIETALIAGRLLGLGPDRLADALGIACTQPQMTSIISWTADAKGMLTGWPAATGVTAALLAQAGMSGNRTILENGLGYAGRVADIGAPRRLEKMVEGLGSLWRFDAARNELFTKRYPTDGFQLTTVAAVLDVRRGPLRDIARIDLPDRIARIEVRVPLVMGATATMFSGGRAGQEALFDRVADPAQPDWTYIALLFDGVWPVAAALADGELTYRQYQDPKLTDPVIRALARKVVEIPDLSMGVFGATVRVELADGRVHEVFKGCIDDFDVTEKLVLGAEAVGKDPAPVAAGIAGLEAESDIRAFTALL